LRRIEEIISDIERKGVAMKLYLRLAWRNIWRHRRRTVIVVIAMAMSLWMMMFYDGFVAGFNNAIYGNAIKFLGGNIQIHAAGYSEDSSKTPLLPLFNDQGAVDAALAIPNVVAASRRINTGGLATTREGAFPVSITGIEPEGELPVSLPAQNITSGRYLAAGDLDSVLIGQGLASAMGVEVGDHFTLAGKSTHDQMRQRTVTVVGIYDLGMAEIEKRSVFMSLKEAQDLYGLPDQSTEVVVTLGKLGEEPGVIAKLEKTLPGYEIVSWETNFPELKAALATKGKAMDIFGFIIILVAGIGIMNLLMMAVYERTREIGLMGAMGLKPRQISLLFIIEGTMMGLVGFIAGIALGIAMNGLLGIVGFDFTSFSTITEYAALINSRVYPTLGLEKIISRALPIVIISMLASLYPAVEASRREPADALHYV
jgi:ABC-type lipoprotein release transport system permease subunit